MATDDPGPKQLPEKWYDKWTTGIKVLTALIAALAGLLAAVIGLLPVICPSCGKEDKNQSTVCQFYDGWIDYAPSKPLDIGSGCQDGTGNKGLVVSKGSGTRLEVSAICQFDDGWHDYAPFPPLRIGSQCQNGHGKSGIIISNRNKNGPNI